MIYEGGRRLNYRVLLFETPQPLKWFCYREFKKKTLVQPVRFRSVTIVRIPLSNAEASYENIGSAAAWSCEVTASHERRCTG